MFSRSSVIRQWLPAAVFVLLLSACTATFIVQQYDGSPLPPERVSILRVEEEEASVIVSLDGEALGYAVTEKNTRVHIEMLPGVHELNAGYKADPSGQVQELRFRTQPGKVYRLVILADPSGSSRVPGVPPWKAAVYEIDPSDNRLLAEVPKLLPKPLQVNPAAVPSLMPQLPLPQATGGAETPAAPPSGTASTAAAPSPPAAAEPAAAASATPSAVGAPTRAPSAAPSSSGPTPAPATSGSAAPPPPVPAPSAIPPAPSGGATSHY